MKIDLMKVYAHCDINVLLVVDTKNFQCKNLSQYESFMTHTSFQIYGMLILSVVLWPLHSAQKHGLLCEVDSDDEDKELCEPFFAHCKAHSIKEIAKRKVKNHNIL